MSQQNLAPHRIVLNLVIAIGSTVAVQNAASAQEHRGTLEQQMACTPDVFRLCGAQIPDENRIVACLRQNTVLLSGPCRAVFQSNDSVPQPRPVTPGRRAYPPPSNNYRAYPPPPDSYDDDNQ
jgi:hypothetical protein